MAAPPRTDQQDWPIRDRESVALAAAPRPLLAQRSFAGLWWGQLCSITGDRLTYLALMGLLFERTGSGTEYAALLALLGNVVLAPVLLFAPFAGAWIDRRSLKSVLVIADLARAAIVLSMPVAYAWSQDLTTVFALVFLLFTINVFFLPAKSAVIPDIVPREQLLAANSLLAGAGVAATAIGALVGGWVVDHWGWGAAMRLDGASYFVSVAGLACIVPSRRRRVDREGRASIAAYLRDVVEGWRLLRSRAAIVVALVALATVWWSGGVLHVAGNDHVQTAASVPGMLRIGILLCAIGAGTGVGTWWINRRGRHYSPATVLGAGLMLASIAVLLFAATKLFVVFALAAVLLGLFAAPALILTETVLQQASGAGQRARLFSAKDFVMRATLLVSMSASAWSVSIAGPRWTLALGALVLLAAAGVVVKAGRGDPSTWSQIEA